MKKAFISAAAFAVVAVSSIAVAPTTSEAIPAFARQTGAACLSCHFQSYPALASMGRAFKIGAFTDVGDQALIEDDNLSLPSVLNLGMVLHPIYTHLRKSGADTAAGTATSNQNQTAWAVPTDNNILVAGRIGTNSGAFVEFNGGAGNFQMMNSFDFGDFKAGLNVAATVFGPTGALELTSVYGQHSAKLGGGDVSAIDAVISGPSSALGATLDKAGKNGSGGDTSVALWGSNGLLTVQVAGVVVGANVANNAINGTGRNNNSFVPMVAATLDTEVGGFNLVAELGTMNGTESVGSANFVSTVKASWLAAQVQGELGDMSLGVYGDFATTKSGAHGNYATASAANAPTFDKKDGYSIRAELEPISHFLVGVGFGSTKVSAVSGNLTQKTSTVHYGVTYEIYQNMELTLAETDVTTGAVAGTVAAAAATPSSLTLGGIQGKTKTTKLGLEAVF